MKQKEKQDDSTNFAANACETELNLLIKANTNEFYNLKMLEDETFNDPNFIHLLINVIKGIMGDQNMIHLLATEVGAPFEFIIKVLEQMQLTQTDILGMLEPKSDP